jgi:hypothetical protein
MKGFFLFILGFLVMPLVPFYAIRGKYPWWMVTPDDQVSPFGQYEETVRKVYEKYGRWAGDTYWLGVRNRMYGLAYKWKIPELKGVTDYSNLLTHKQRLDYPHFSIQKIDLILNGKIYREHTIQLGPVYLIFGWKLNPVHSDKHIPRKEVNMDARPTFSFRTKRSA